MVPITMEDVDLEFQFRDQTTRRIRTEIALTFGNGKKSYPKKGIPLPAKRRFGVNNAITRIWIQPSLDGFIYAYDHEAHTIRIFICSGQVGELKEVSDKFVPGPTKLLLDVYGS